LEVEYDYVLIASQFLNEILPQLLSLGVNKEKTGHCGRWNNLIFPQLIAKY